MPIILGALGDPDTNPAVADHPVVAAAVTAYTNVFRAAGVALDDLRDMFDGNRHIRGDAQEVLLEIAPIHAQALALWAGGH